MSVTLEQFSKMIPTNKEASAWYDVAIPLFKKYEINTINRIASFMAQCGHESGDFRTIEENLNYSAKRLREVFPRYFPTDAAAQAAAGKPEVIANIVYNDANRKNKLGNTQPGDGWRFRGGGIKQLTGRWNFTEFGKSIGKTAEEAADYVRTKQGAFESACWFWATNKLERYADRDDIKGMTVAINGGTIGLEDRTNRYRKAKSILNGSTAPTVSESANQTLTVGSKGDLVKKVQQKLKISADGVFGPNTKKAVEEWQVINKLNKTGVLTPDQIGKLLS